MNVLVICDEQEKEMRYLKDISKKNIARVSEEKWRIEDFFKMAQLRELLKEETDLDVVYLDVTMLDSIAIAERIRRENKKTIFLLIADTTISPMCYLKPSIQAASLLLRPLEKQQVQKAVADTWNLYQENQIGEEEYFVVEDGVESLQIPFKKIYYFFSSEKKVYLVLENQQYGFYDTLGNLEQRLPAYFIRSHRSFIVNQEKIREVYLSRGELILEQDICVPISRSYKSNIKELKKCLK